MAKTYLGDGCYVDYDGYALILTAEDGVSVTNRIVLEPEVYASLGRFVQALKEAPPAAGPAYGGPPAG